MRVASHYLSYYKTPVADYLHEIQQTKITSLDQHYARLRTDYQRNGRIAPPNLDQLGQIFSRSYQRLANDEHGRTVLVHLAWFAEGVPVPAALLGQSVAIEPDEYTTTLNRLTNLGFIPDPHQPYLAYE